MSLKYKQDILHKWEDAAKLETFFFLGNKIVGCDVGVQKIKVLATSD